MSDFVIDHKLISIFFLISILILKFEITPLNDITYCQTTKNNSRIFDRGLVANSILKHVLRYSMIDSYIICNYNSLNFVLQFHQLFGNYALIFSDFPT